jgi:adenosylcobinamide kinase / adenosylcobinamide-phosphate guanylyltransferase
MAGELILVLGGARSGKSGQAQKLALELGGADVLYVATAQPLDEEMRTRVAAHQADRPSGWQTLEAPTLRGVALAEELGRARVVLVDCVTLLVSNALLAAGPDPSSPKAEAAVEGEIAALLDARLCSSAIWIVVSNEVGLGLVPDNVLGRVYRDMLGRVNRRLAAQADRVLLMVAGIPMRVK